MAKGIFYRAREIFPHGFRASKQLPGFICFAYETKLEFLKHTTGKKKTGRNKITPILSDYKVDNILHSLSMWPKAKN